MTAVDQEAKQRSEALIADCEKKVEDMDEQIRAIVECEGPIREQAAEVGKAKVGHAHSSSLETESNDLLPTDRRDAEEGRD